AELKPVQAFSNIACFILRNDDDTQSRHETSPRVSPAVGQLTGHEAGSAVAAPGMTNNQAMPIRLRPWVFLPFHARSLDHPTCARSRAYSAPEARRSKRHVHHRPRPAPDQPPRRDGSLRPSPGPLGAPARAVPAACLAQTPPRDRPLPMPPVPEIGHA